VRKKKKFSDDYEYANYEELKEEVWDFMDFVDHVEDVAHIVKDIEYKGTKLRDIFILLTHYESRN